MAMSKKDYVLLARVLAERTRELYRARDAVISARDETDVQRYQYDLAIAQHALTQHIRTVVDIAATLKQDRMEFSTTKFVDASTYPEETK